MKFEIYRDVGPSHLAPDGRLSVRSLVDFMQDCSIFQLDSERTLDAWFKANDAGMFLAHRQIHIVRMPVHGERMRIVTWVYRCNPSYGLRNTNMYDAEGNVCVYSCASGAFVSYATGQMVRVPDEVLRTVPLYEPYPMEYLRDAKGIPACESCGFPIRPGVYLYGEMVDSGLLSRAVDEIAKADVLLLLGTNLTSEVFGNYIKYFGGKYLIIIHKHSHYLDDTADMVFLDHPRNILPLLGYGEPEDH